MLGKLASAGAFLKLHQRAGKKWQEDHNFAAWIV